MRDHISILSFIRLPEENTGSTSPLQQAHVMQCSNNHQVVTIKKQYQMKHKMITLLRTTLSQASVI